MQIPDFPWSCNKDITNPSLWEAGKKGNVYSLDKQFPLQNPWAPVGCIGASTLWTDCPSRGHSQFLSTSTNFIPAAHLCLCALINGKTFSHRPLCINGMIRYCPCIGFSNSR